MDNEETLKQKPLALKTGLKNKIYRCPIQRCPFFCRYISNFDVHLETQHFCMDCAAYCNNLQKHVCPTPTARLGHVDIGRVLDLSHFSELSRSHGGMVLMYKYNANIDSLDIEDVFTKLNKVLTTFLEQLFEIHQHSKIEIGMGILMQKEIQDDEMNRAFKTTIIYFKSSHYELQNKYQIKDVLLKCASDIMSKKNLFMENGSGWSVVNIESIEIKIGEIRLIRDVSGAGYLPMPVPHKSGFVNFRNKNDKCFLYCVAASLFADEERRKTWINVSKKAYHIWEKYFTRLDTNGINFPVSIQTDIPIFERNNNVGISVLGYRNGQISVLRTCPNQFQKKITLFLIEKKLIEAKFCHYVLVTDTSKFLSNGRRNKQFICETCFRSFANQKTKDEHECGKMKVVETLPKEGERIEFKRMEMSIPYPFVLYYDFECFSDPLHVNKGESTTLNYEYKAASYSLCLVYSGRTGLEVRAFEYYDGPNPIHHFYERIFYHAQNVLSEIRSTNNFLTPSTEELSRHNRASHCEFCQRLFTTANEMEIDGENEKKKPVVKCYHHNHQTGKYLHALCQGCNLKIKYKNELVCVAHNSSKFDVHFLLQHLDSPLFDSKDVNVIAKGGEKIIQLEITAKNLYIPSLKQTFDRNVCNQFCGSKRVKVRLIDSYQFIPGSLEKLAFSLKKEKSSSFELLKQGLKFMFPLEQGNMNSDLLTEKLKYPYTYLSSANVLEPGHPIPPKKMFYNDLSLEDVSDKDWYTVQQLISDFKINDFREFTRIYTMTDTILLGIVFENFRKQCFETYKLDPTYVCTTSGYSWQCFLHFTKAKIEYIRDMEMLKMIKDGIRGGVSFCTQKINTANNERCPAGFDPEKERTHLLYFDLNSLYATALTDKYPSSNYEWASQEELDDINWQTYEGEKGYILKVDLSYPEKVQDETLDLPLAPEKCVIQATDLSQEQRQDMRNLNIGDTFISKPRLLLHCGERKEYVVHYKALKYYMDMGMVLEKIHSGFKFNEQPYFRDYILFNIEQRKLAKTESQRALVKLLSNAIFGKSLQGNKDKLIVKFCNSSVRAKQLMASERYHDFMPLTNNVSMFFMRPKKVKLDNPIQSGFVCLDLAKVLFYQGYYPKLKKTFGDRINNLYSDTDCSVCIVRDPENTLWQKYGGHPRPL